MKLRSQIIARLRAPVGLFVLAFALGAMLWAGHSMIAHANGGPSNYPDVKYSHIGDSVKNVPFSAITSIPGAPSGLERGLILVSKHGTPPQVELQQTWGTPGAADSLVLLDQAQGLKGLGGGVAFDFGNGISGQRALYPAGRGRNFALVSYYWKNGDVGVVLTAGLSASRSDQTVLSWARALAQASK